MPGKRPITGPILGLPDLDYEVTIIVRRRSTGSENRMYYPNVGRVQTDHILAADLGEAGAGLAAEGMPQALLMMVGFNASPRTGRTVEVKDGGAMAPATTEGMDNDG